LVEYGLMRSILTYLYNATLGILYYRIRRDRRDAIDKAIMRKDAITKR